MGLFLTVEGPDGAGKTTQIELLRDYLSDKGYDIIVCREPGGTPISEAVRNVILNKEFTEMGHMTELLLYAAARAQLIEEVIRPALEDGKIVICDRFVESSAVYQGIARGMGIDLVYKVNQFAIGDTMPDLTIMIDLDAEAGISRKKKHPILAVENIEERKNRQSWTEWKARQLIFIRRLLKDTDNLRACIQIESILLTEV